MKKMIAILVILIVIILICYILIKRNDNTNKTKLLSIEYMYNNYDDIYDSVYLSYTNNSMTIKYKNNKVEEVKIEEDVFMQLDEIMKKYDVTNWNKFKKNELEYIDGDNTSIYYECSDGTKGYVSKGEYPKGKEKFFSEIKSIIESNS